ncbi:hypothetical protein B4P00_21300 [Shewanella xiamenensis]|nr:hypothetical protein [Shewanella xiamenensis]
MTLYYLVNSGIEQQATLQYETIFLPARFQLLKIMGIEVNQYESLLPSHIKTDSFGYIYLIFKN